MSDLTQDAFLGGRLSVWQPKSGFRAGSDSVFLASSCTAKPGDQVLELGCGVGVVSLCLAQRVSGLEITGLERDPTMVTLALRNVVNAPITVIQGDVAKPPDPVSQERFQQVIANPPFFAAGTKSGDGSRAAARHIETPLASWVNTARRRLLPNGWLTVIIHIEQLAEILSQLRDGFGRIEVRPISSRPNKTASRTLVRAQRGSLGPFRLLPTLITHAENESGALEYSELAEAILRQGAALDWS